MNGATVKVYSKAKDGSKALSANFKVREFACSDGTDTIFIAPTHAVRQNEQQGMGNHRN